MWEIGAALSATIVTLIAASIGNGIKKSREIHDAVLTIKTELVALHGTVNDNLADTKERTAMLSDKLYELCGRMQKLETDFRQYLLFTVNNAQNDQSKPNKKTESYRM